MFQNFGPLQVMIVLLVVLMLFGVGKLPQIGRGIGQAINEFRGAVGKNDNETSDEENTTDSVQRKASD